MIAILYILISLCLAVLTMTTYAAVHTTIAERRHQRFTKLLHDKYLESICAAIKHPDSKAIIFPRISSGRSKLLLSQLLGLLADSTYGYNLKPIEDIVAQYHLDRFLARRAQHSRALHRARYIKLMLHIPLGKEAINLTTRYTTDKNPYVRLYALLLMIYNTPDHTIDIVERHPYPLNDYELSQISTLLLHKFVPPAIIEPLLSSRKSNHLLLGMELIRRYSITETTYDLTSLTLHPDTAVRNSALHTLTTMQAPLNAESLITAVTTMTLAERKDFYRLLIREGYSANALKVFTATEKDTFLADYVERAMGLHKKSLYKKEPVSV